MLIIDVPCTSEQCGEKLSLSSEDVGFFLTGCNQFGQTAVALYECTYCNQSSSVDLDSERVAELFENRVKFEEHVTVEPLQNPVKADDRSRTAFRVLRAIRDAAPEDLFELIVGKGV